MALFVGLNVSLRTTSICVVEANSSPVWEGKAESEPTMLIKALFGRRNEIALVGLEACRYQSGFSAHSLRAGFKPCVSKRVMRKDFSRHDRTRPTAAMPAALLRC